MAYTGTSTATTNFDKTVAVLIRKTLLDELLPTMPHLADGNFIKATFVKGTNSTMRFLRMPHLALQSDANIVGHSAGTAPWLTEGESPTPGALSFGYEEFTAYQAGQRIQITDVAAMESPLELASEAAVRVARQAAEVADNYVGQTLAAGTQVLYAGSGNTQRTDVAATDVLNGSIVRRVVQRLKANNVPSFGGSYKAIIHPAVVFDFEEDANVGGWLDANRYRGSQAILDGELGKYAGIRFFESARSRIFAAGGAGGTDVYSTFVFGPDAYAFGDWGSVSTHVVGMTPAPGNELAQFMSIGWKGFIGAKLVTGPGARYYRIESASGL